jgi:hypothetical protein
MLRPWGTDGGMTQLGALSLPKGALLELHEELPLRHILSPMLRHKLVLEEGDLPDKAFVILMRRC